MSANFNVRTGVIAAMGVSGLLLSACANSHHKAYPGDVYAYESGPSNCGGTTTVHQPVTVSPRYSSGCDTAAVIAPPAPVVPDVVYADCGTITNMGCNYDAYESTGGHSGYTGTTTTHTGSTGYVAPATGYTGTTGYTSGSTYSSGSAIECPAGSTRQADGTCMQGGSSYSGSYTSSTTTSTYSPSTTTSYSSGSVECPAGTTLQSDNTCLQSSGSSYTGGSSSSYTSSSSTSYTTQPVTCPSGTVMQGDGSCMSTGYSSSSSYTADDYLPIRK